MQTFYCLGGGAGAPDSRVVQGSTVLHASGTELELENKY